MLDSHRLGEHLERNLIKPKPDKRFKLKVYKI